MLLKIAMIDNACFSVKLEKVNYDTFQSTLEQAYLVSLLNPKYLFLGNVDYESLNASVKSLPDADPGNTSSEHFKHPHVVQIANRYTGTMIHLVELPEAEPGTLIFGFFTQEDRGFRAN